MFQTKIVGGDETGVNEFPMMAGIIVATHRHIRCGATIISNHHVLTAAHCMRGLNDTSQMGVLVGEHDVTIGWETNATQLFKVFRYDPHPSYDPNKQDFDIGIITINGFIAFTNEVGPACLPFQHYLDSFGGSVVYMLGWGTDEYAGSQSNALRKVEVSVTNFLTCKQVFPGLTYRQICTLSEGMDACQYDSGGPVLWQNPTTRRLVLVGIISYGSGCASSAPAVNTRVGSFIEWIVRTTGAQFCQAE
ncbi:hypothetical protein QAD02_012540 [Eretmocerus hayati]|uniref:Uncharacterized protein n=1 Tax=Eretmocerus hayati TaxID=131215 RepID=A0ACC2P0W2_9HYME|nr:hypothetical protein QAD02_012540 [Eretmocerus hayati]